MPNSSFTILLKATKLIYLLILISSSELISFQNLKYSSVYAELKSTRCPPLQLLYFTSITYIRRLFKALSSRRINAINFSIILESISTRSLTSARRGYRFTGSKESSSLGRFQSIMLNFRAKKDSYFIGILIKPQYAITIGYFRSFDAMYRYARYLAQNRSFQLSISSQDTQLLLARSSIIRASPRSKNRNQLLLVSNRQQMF